MVPDAALKGMELTWEEIHDVLKTIVLYIIGNQDDDADLNHEDRVPRFWANSGYEHVIADFIVLGIGVCFGAIHCASL